jgi:glycosyltransferase involved in cell wall biosynthesis
MSKIVIDARWIKQTGIGRYVENILVAAVGLNTKHELVLLIRPEDKASLPKELRKLELIETDAVWYTPQEQIQLPKILDAAKPDLVHFTQFNIPLQYRKPFVVNIHDLTMLKFKSIRSGFLAPFTYGLKDVVMRHVLKTAINRSRAIFVLTDYVKQDIKKRYRTDEKKMILTPCALDEVRAKPIVSLKKFGITKPYLLHVGNAFPSKNLGRLIDAFAKLKADDKAFDHQLIFVGKKDSFHVALEKKAAKLKLSDSIIFTGFVTDAEMAGLYQNAALYVLPALSEGFGIPGLEAMSYGVPVASSNATCLPEVYDKAAEFFDGKKVDDIAAAIKRVIDSPKRQADLKKLGKERLEHFSWQESAQALLDGYDKALKAQAKPSGLRLPRIGR